MTAHHTENESGQAIDTATTYWLVADEHRRAVLRCLRRRPQWSIAELSTAVTRQLWNRAPERGVVTPERVRLQLCLRQLPALAMAGIVTFEGEDVVATERVAPCLEALRRYEAVVPAAASPTAPLRAVL